MGSGREYKLFTRGEAVSTATRKKKEAIASRCGRGMGRRVAMYMAGKYTMESKSAIGEELGGVTGQAVTKMVQKVWKEMKKNRKLPRVIEAAHGILLAKS